MNTRVSGRRTSTDKRAPSTDRHFSSLGECPVLSGGQVDALERWKDLTQVKIYRDELNRFNETWGYGRSFLLCGDELAGKLRKQMTLIQETAVNAKAGYLVEQRCEAMIRGLRLADQRIREAGHQPVDRTEWQAEHPAGLVVKMVRTRAAIPQESDYAYFALEDVVKWIPKEIIELMNQFPGSSTVKVTTSFEQIRKSTEERLAREAATPKVKTGDFIKDLDDDIPF